MASNGVSTFDMSDRTLGFIGGGNMARAIGAPLIEKGLIKASNVWVSARTDATLEFWKNLGANTTLGNHEIVANCQTTVLAVKPQFLDTALQSLKGHICPIEFASKIFVSVIAGVTVLKLKTKLASICGISTDRIVRTLPNTSLSVGEGITVYCCTEEMNNREDLKFVESIFSSSGLVEKIDETLMNAVGALSGSAPAFAYLMIEGLADGAVKNGVPRALATKLAAQVLTGAGKMVQRTGKHPGQLKDEVCSPGGTTIAGIHAMEIGGVRGSLMNAIEATVKRCNEL